MCVRWRLIFYEAKEAEVGRVGSDGDTDSEVGAESFVFDFEVKFSDM